MKVMVITSSPNMNGLTAACGNAAKVGAEEAGAQVVEVRLNDLNVGKCNACGNAWGTCRTAGTCQVEDGFQALHASLAEMDAFVVVTPVYWGDMSESAKAFFDRVRRCEATKGETNLMQGKPVISVAAAGGTGGGTLTCLSTMERLFTHLKAERFDFIGVTRKSRNYKLGTIRASAGEMVKFLQAEKE